MKRNILFSSFLAITSMIGLSSCEKTEGALYSGPENKISFFSASTGLPMSTGTINVPVGRSSSEGDLSVPVALSATGAGYTDVFKVDGPVLFAAGEAKSYAKITYGDFSKIDPSTLSVTAVGNDVKVGLAFPVTLTIADDNASLSNIKKISVLASSTLEFEDLGTITMNSTAGWAEEDVQAKIQKAKGVNVYKMVSPFGGGSFAFMVKSDGKTVICPNQVIAVSSQYGPVTMGNVTGTISGKTVTLNVGGYTVSAGSFGSGVEIITLP